MPTVTIDSTEPDGLIDVNNATRRNRELGQAEIVMRDTSSNRNLASPGVDLTIDYDGDTSLSGYVTGEPTRSNGRLVVLGMVRAGELKHLTANRVVYNELSSTVVKELVTKRAEELDRILVHTGDDASNWTSEAPVGHLYTGGNAGLYDWGTDMVFLGARQGHDETLLATYTNVTSDHIRDGIFRLETRLTADDPGNLLDCEIELRTPNGETYVWEPDLRLGFHTYELPAEEAHTDGDLSTNGQLQYRFIPSGGLVQNTGIFLDHAATVPFVLNDRDSDISIGSIDTTSRRITRRIQEPIGIAIDDIAIEDNASYWVDTSDSFYYSTAGEPVSTNTIADGSTKVVEVSVDRDYEDVINEVSIAYGDDSSVTVRDPESISFYGPVPREEPIETNLQKESEAVDRGMGFLRRNAWNDQIATFHIADESYASLQPGTRIDVNWSPESLTGAFLVDEVAVGEHATGVVSVSITASSD